MSGDVARHSENTFPHADRPQHTMRPIRARICMLMAERLLLIATLFLLTGPAAAQDALSIAIDEAKAELAARKSWARSIPPVSQVGRRGNTLRIGIGTPGAAESTRWRQWWERALCEAPELKKIMLLNGGVQVYAGAEPVEGQEVFFTKADCYARDPDWNKKAPQGVGPGPSYQVAPAPPPASSAPANLGVGPATLKTKKIVGALPLSLAVPDDFSDVTQAISGAIAAPERATYCDPVDAQFLRDQLLGKRADELPNKGCIVVERDPSSSYSANERRFSVEKDIDTMNKWAPSHQPRFEVRNHSLVKREVRGVPILTFIQDSRTNAGSARVYFLYVADGTDAWVVTLASGKQDGVSAMIWGAVLAGLQ